MNEPTKSLNQLISKLSELETSSFNPQEVTTLLSETDVSAGELRPLVNFQKGRYTRNLVYRSSTFDVIVLCWPPHTGTPVHDHGRQLGWVRVLEGALEEIRYCNDDEPDRLDETQNWAPKEFGRAVVPAGRAVAAVDAKHGVHRLTAMDQPAISLHIYSKPLDTCLVFDSGSGHIGRKNLEYDTTPDTRSKQMA